MKLLRLTLVLAAVMVVTQAIAATNSDLIGTVKYMDMDSSASPFYVLVGIQTPYGEVYAYRSGAIGPAELALSDAASARQTVDLGYNTSTDVYTYCIRSF